MGMEIGNENIEGGGGPSEEMMKLVKAEKGTTSREDETLWLTFERHGKDNMRSSYPFGRSSQGKLSAFLKAARKMLDLGKDANVDLDSLMDKWALYRRVERSWEQEGETVEFFYHIPIKFVDEKDMPDVPAKAKKGPAPEKVQPLIEALKEGLTRDEINVKGKEVGMSEGEIDLFMMNAIKKEKTIEKKEDDKYYWKAEEPKPVEDKAKEE